MVWSVNGYWIDGSNVDMSARPLVAGEILLAGSVSDSTGTSGVGPGTGWSQIGTWVVNTTDAQSVAVWKNDTVAAGGETSLSFTTNNTALSWLLAIGGGDQTTHFDVTPPSPANLGSSGSGLTSPATATVSITTVSNGSLLVGVLASDVTANLNAAVAFSGPGLTWTPRIDGQGGFRNVDVATAEQTNAGAVSVDAVATFASGTAGLTMFLLAIRNESPPAGGAALDSRGSTRKSRRRPGRTPYSRGRYLRPRIDAFTAPELLVGSVGLASETDSALALAPVQIRAAGLSSETDTALALSGGQQGAVGVAVEADSALALSAVQIRATGTATETDTALALSAVVVVPQDAPISSIRQRPGRGPYSFGRMFRPRIDALTNPNVQSAATGLASEADTAFARAAVQIKAAGLSVETDTAFALTGGVPGQVGAASETDTALALAAKQIRATGLSAEVDAALALTPMSIRVVGLAFETDTAFARAPGGPQPVGMAVETDTAFALGGGQTNPNSSPSANGPRIARRRNGEIMEVLFDADGMPYAAKRKNGAVLLLTQIAGTNWHRALTSRGDIVTII